MARPPLMAAAAAASLAFVAACSDSVPLSPELAGAPASLSQAPEEVMEGEFIVRLADDADPAVVARDNGLQVAQALRSNRAFVLTGLRGAALRDRLLSTADSKNDATHFGAGRLNSYRAVTGATLPSGQ